MKKKIFLWSLLTTMMVGLLSLGLASCDSDPAPLSAADEVSASYTGTLQNMKSSAQSARCYVTLTKLSSDAVRLEKLICEELNLDLNPVNLTAVEDGKGSITLRSETSKFIQGTYYQHQLTLSFTNKTGVTFFFTGMKN